MNEPGEKEEGVGNGMKMDAPEDKEDRGSEEEMDAPEDKEVREMRRNR